VAYLLWAATPEAQLRRLGITYFPSKHWALALPLWLLLAVAYAYWVYEGLNAVATPPMSSPTTLYDATCKWAPPPLGAGGRQKQRQPTRTVPPLAHVPPPVVSRVLYGGGGGNGGGGAFERSSGGAGDEFYVYELGGSGSGGWIKTDS
jgi:hypothetical protein